MANPIKPKRYTIEESENQYIIRDNQGLDDYYHLGNDIEDITKICELLNKYHTESLLLKKHLRDSVDALICEYSSYIDEDLESLNTAFTDDKLLDYMEKD